MVANPVIRSSKTTIYRARWVLPVVRPAVHDGAVAVAGGRISGVGSFADVRRDHPGAAVVDMGEAVLLPGLVNTHVHLDNSAMAGSTPPGDGDFIAWIEAFLEAKDTMGLDEKRRATEAACRSLKALGTIAVGDICPTLLSSPFLAQEPLRARIFVEVTGIGPQRGGEKLAEAISKLRLAEDEFADAGLSFSLAPHAPYSTDALVIRSIIRENTAQGRITSFHLAESAQEVGFLTGEDDSFERAIRRWGFWEEGWRPPRMRPVAYLENLGGLAPGVMLVHCVQLLDEEIDAIAGSGCSVCLCPRSNDRIGVGRPRIREMLAAGMEPALGTDGLGSVDSLSVFDEMAFIRKAFPEIEPEALLTMATLNGARALRFEHEIGSLERGRIARFLVYRGDIGRDPADALTSGIDHMLLSWVGEGNV